MDRRSFILLAGSAGLAGFVPLWMTRIGRAEERFAVMMADDEWRKKLTPEQYLVLRKEGTERAFTSPLNDEHRRGVFKCAGCGSELFSSDAKFDSGSGWPSFFQPLSDKAVGMSVDHKLVYPRTEVHCAHCGGHLGHLFDDGPQPTGKRYCVNGIAMNFIPEKSE
jgi:peptide-methionine (R)-S-oxide reductase